MLFVKADLIQRLVIWRVKGIDRQPSELLDEAIALVGKQVIEHSGKTITQSAPGRSLCPRYCFQRRDRRLCSFFRCHLINAGIVVPVVS